jgi:glyoxylase-like metal-dependent hydrolase (beta-lactamase superfamily II)
MFISHRREFLQTLLGGAAGLTLSCTAFGQGAPAPITATKLAPDLAVMMGDGGNVAVIVSDGALMMIDGGLPDRAADMAKAIHDNVDSRKVATLFNTHWHFDHTGSNELLGKSGAKIIAHENTKKWLSRKVTMEALNRTFDPVKPEGLPVETFAKGGKMTFGKQKMEYMHVPPSHTDSDTYVFLLGSERLAHRRPVFQRLLPDHRLLHRRMAGWNGDAS